MTVAVWCAIPTHPLLAQQGVAALTAFDSAKARALLVDHLPCLGCHAFGDAGGRIAPDLATVRARRSAAYIAAIIDDPQRVVPGAMMPRVAMRSATRDLLIRYLANTVSVPAGTAAPPRRAVPASAPPVSPGAALYARWCAACHGARGDGDGPNARHLPVRPARHADATVMRTRTDDQLFDAIAGGGATLGRSPRMPPFGQTLAPDEIRALVAYLRALCACQGPTRSNAP